MMLCRTGLPTLLVFILLGCAASRKTAEAPAATESQQQDRTKAAGAPGTAAEEASEAPAAAPVAPAPPEMPRSTGGVSGEADDFERLGQRLDGALALSAPDCTTAWALRDKICDLSQRLCDLAARSAEPEVAERCTDGRGRCEKATSRVRAACAE